MAAYERLGQSDAAKKDLTVSEPTEIAETKGTDVSGAETAADFDSFYRKSIRVIAVGFIALNGLAGTVVLLLNLFEVDDYRAWDFVKILWVWFNSLLVAIAVYFGSYKLLDRFT